jgi:hypothetical protein
MIVLNSVMLFDLLLAYVVCETVPTRLRGDIFFLLRKGM